MLAEMVEKIEAEVKRRKAVQVAAQRRLAHDDLETFLSIFTPDFLPGWHITEMCRHAKMLEEAIRGDPEDLDLLRRLTVTMPPRHAKSQTYAKALPLHFLARNPDKEVFVVCGGSDLAEEHGAWCKNMVPDPRFKAIFPDFSIRTDSNAKDRLLTPQGGGIRFAGRGGTIIGRGAHLFIIDDPFRSAQEADSETVNQYMWDWFWTSPMTRLAPSAAVVVMHTRWRLNDLIGRIKDMEAAQPPAKRRWKHVDYPAIAEEDEPNRKKGEPLHPARFGLQHFDELRTHMPARDWLALYQQRPVAEEGNFFKANHFHMYDPAKLPPKDQLYFYLATDYAWGEKEENDYTVVWPMAVTADDHQFFMPDFVHAKMDPYESAMATLDLAERYDVMQILIEPGASFLAMETLLTREMQKRGGKYFQIVTPPASGTNKRHKATPAQTASGMGRIHLPDTPRVRMEVMPELLAFDKGSHDDLVDAIAIPSRCLHYRVLPTPTGLNFSDSLEKTPEERDWVTEDDLVELDAAVDSGGGRIPSLFSDW